MPTLANIDGRSLVPDLSGPFKTLEALAERRRKKQAERESLEALRVAGGLPTPPVTSDEGGGLSGVLRSIFGDTQDASGPEGEQEVPEELEGAVRLALGQRVPPPVKSKDAGLLGQVNPALAKEAAGVAERGSEVESAEFRQAATDGMATAKEVQNLPNFAARRRRLAELASKAISDGTPEDQQRLLQLMNLDEAHLDLELTKMQVTGQGMLAAVPEIKPTGPFRLFETPEQRDALAKLMISNPKAASTMIANRRVNLEQDRIAAAPQSELAQALERIDTDEARGDLTPETAAARRRSLRLEATKAGRAEDRRIAAARAAAAAPKTDLAKLLTDIQADLAAGRLTPEVAAQMTANARADAVQTEPVPFSGDVPAGFMLADPDDPRKGVIPIPGAPEGDPKPVPFSGKVPAGFMLADPDDPRKGVIPIPGVSAEVAEDTTAQRSAEAKIQRIMADQGVDRKTAQGIVDGVLRVTRDPVTGDAIITNLATGVSFVPEVGGALAAPPTQGVTSAVQPEDVLSSNPADIGNITAALGGQGIVVGALNAVADLFFLPLPGLETDRGIVTLNSIGTRTMLGLAAEFPGRPSNLTREKIEKMLVKPASISAGPVRGLTKFKNVRQTIAVSLQIAESVSSGRVVSPTGRTTKRRFTPQQVGEANAAVLALVPLLEEYDTIISQMEGRGDGTSSGTTPSGVQWSIQQ